MPRYCKCFKRFRGILTQSPTKKSTSDAVCVVWHVQKQKLVFLWMFSITFLVIASWNRPESTSTRTWRSISQNWCLDIMNNALNNRALIMKRPMITIIIALNSGLHNRKDGTAKAITFHFSSIPTIHPLPDPIHFAAVMYIIVPPSIIGSICLDPFEHAYSTAPPL